MMREGEDGGAIQQIDEANVDVRSRSGEDHRPRMQAIKIAIIRQVESWFGSS